MSGMSVIFGAFTAHLMKSLLAPDAMNLLEIGARYQMYHGLALLFVGVLAHGFDRRGFQVAGVCFLAGCLIFSGSLYAMALSGISTFAQATPVGGVAFILGWIEIL